MDNSIDKAAPRMVWLMAVSLLLIAMDSLGVMKPMRGAIETKLLPLESLGMEIARIASWPVKTASYYRVGPKRIADLEARLAEKVVDYQELTYLKQENEKLKQLVGGKNNSQLKMQPVRIFGWSTNQILVGAGEKMGIKPGMSVTANRVLVGRISKVSVGVSELLPIISEQSRVAVVVAGRQTEGIVRGEGSRLLMDKVLQSDAVETGEVVETSGADGGVPGLVVGKVAEVTGDKGQVYKQVWLEPIVDINTVQSVEVVLDSE